MYLSTIFLLFLLTFIQVTGIIDLSDRKEV
nr:MAG TPA: hypothetical protein [Caudoviricetes sp.]